MDPIRWNRLWSLFDAALERPAASRTAFLDQACRDDPALRPELEGLLHAHSDAVAWLDRPPAAACVDDLAPGTRIGSYRVLEALGEGGMGRVYLVERDDGSYRQRAALKLLAPGFAHPALVGRFRRERQIMAALVHPGIARLLDGGHTDQGLPWLVMEYVEGAAIDCWCNRQAAPLATRLALIEAVCAAVDHAHRQLVVHRDIKPGNILVDAKGRPVLLDFGIAKLLDHGSDDGESQWTGWQPLTPRYAAPEQLQGAPIGAATDVFALGLLLHELVCGLPAFESGTPAERLAAITAERRAPLRPSALRRAAALDAAGELPREALRLRRERIPPELDWIVARALQPRPADRYPTAAALGADLRALAEHRPPAARPAPIAYRARKLLRRRWQWAAAAALFLALCGGFAWRLADETARTRAALAESRLERDRAEAVADFLRSLFRAADPTRSGGTAISALALLERGRTQLAADASLDPLVRAALQDTLAEVHVAMGEYPAARALVAAARASLPEPAPPVLQARIETTAGALSELEGDHRGARDALQRALELQLAADGAPSLATVAIAEKLARTLQSLGEHEAAGRLFREGWELRRAQLPADHPLVADAALRLGSWYWTGGQLEQAERWYAEALALRRGAAVPDLPELARAVDAYGTVSHLLGRYAVAIAHFEEAVALRRRVLGEHHRHTADSLSHLGAALYEQGDDEASERASRAALAIYARIFPDDSPVVTRLLNNLALVRQRRGALDEARALFGRALAANRKALGAEHALVASNLNNLGLVEEDAGNLPVAEAHLREALAIQRRRLGPDHPDTAYALTNLARVLAWSGNRGEAMPLFAEALALRNASLPPEHPSRAEVLAWYGHARCAGGEAGAGLAMLREALAIREAHAAGHALALAQSRALLGLCLARSGARSEGEALLAESRPLLQQRLVPSHRLRHALATAAP